MQFIFPQVCLQVGGLDSRPDIGSICWISGWWLEMFEGRCGEIQKGFLSMLLGMLYFKFGYLVMHIYLNLITKGEIIVWLDCNAVFWHC